MKTILLITIPLLIVSLVSCKFASSCLKQSKCLEVRQGACTTDGKRNVCLVYVNKPGCVKRNNDTISFVCRVSSNETYFPVKIKKWSPETPLCFETSGVAEFAVKDGGRCLGSSNHRLNGTSGESQCIGKNLHVKKWLWRLIKKVKGKRSSKRVETTGSCGDDNTKDCLWKIPVDICPPPTTEPSPTCPPTNSTCSVCPPTNSTCASCPVCPTTPTTTPPTTTPPNPTCPTVPVRTPCSNYKTSIILDYQSPNTGSTDEQAFGLDYQQIAETFFEVIFGLNPSNSSTPYTIIQAKYKTPFNVLGFHGPDNLGVGSLPSNNLKAEVDFYELVANGGPSFNVKGILNPNQGGRNISNGLRHGRIILKNKSTNQVVDTLRFGTLTPFELNTPSSSGVIRQFTSSSLLYIESNRFGDGTALATLYRADTNIANSPSSLVGNVNIERWVLTFNQEPNSQTSCQDITLNQ